MTLAVTASGFADPVHEAQSAFRAMMEAVARPGTVQPLAGIEAAPAPLTAELAAIALTLCDADTPLWLSPCLASEPAVTRFLAFHCGAPLVNDPAKAAFALALGWDEAPALSALAQGEPAYPDRSTTLIVAVPMPGEDSAVRLSGPGIKGQRALHDGVVPAARRAEFAHNRAAFPLGVDVILAAPGHVLGLPRTTTMEG